MSASLHISKISQEDPVLIGYTVTLHTTEGEGHGLVRKEFTVRNFFTKPMGDDHGDVKVALSSATEFSQALSVLLDLPIVIDYEYEQ